MPDNVTLPPPAGTNIAARDIAGALVGEGILVDAAGADVLGDVTASPAANTLLGRLKALYDALVDRLPTLGAKAASGSVSIVPATNSGMATDAALGAGQARSVTPGTSPLAAPARAIYVGGAGNLAVTSGGQTVTFMNVPTGVVLPVSATHVLAANTTATNIVALI